MSNLIMRKKKNLEIESLVNLDADEIMSGLDKIMKESVDDNDIHSIGSNSDTVDDIDGDWFGISDSDEDWAVNK
ncbi:1475_t:CDS:2 [Funneliformis mosseae]|uniref:1475_t:CDS:1 n=1 Tax=Funneliformis mosseae TaxID=27381 RepID=A0A9N9GLP9_FUNMO|nr:1475_t:CDS:2 [Funneliformis mosseae]